MAAITIESLQSHEETSGLELRRLSLAVGVWDAIATSPGEPVHRHVGWAEAVEGRQLAAGLGIIVSRRVRNRLISLIAETLGGGNAEPTPLRRSVPA